MLHTQQKKNVLHMPKGHLFLRAFKHSHSLLDNPKSNNERKKLLPQSIFYIIEVYTKKYCEIGFYFDWWSNFVDG